MFFFMTAIQTAAQVMGLVHVLYSRQLHTHLISHQWCLIQMSHAGVLELKYKTYQCVPQVSFYVSYAFRVSFLKALMVLLSKSEDGDTYPAQPVISNAN